MTGRLARTAQGSMEPEVVGILKLGKRQVGASITTIEGVTPIPAAQPTPGCPRKPGVMARPVFHLQRWCPATTTTQRPSPEPATAFLLSPSPVAPACPAPSPALLSRSQCPSHSTQPFSPTPSAFVPPFFPRCVFDKENTTTPGMVPLHGFGHPHCLLCPFPGWSQGSPALPGEQRAAKKTTSTG